MRKWRPYLDVLIMSALKEEVLVLQMRESSIEVPYIPEVPDFVLLNTNNALRCGLTSVGAMTNSMSAKGTLEMIRKTCPKCIILMGVAGGHATKYMRGDVAIADQIVVSSFAKLIDESFKEYIESNAIVDDDEIVNTFHENLDGLGIDLSQLAVPKLLPRKHMDARPVNNRLFAHMVRVGAGDKWKKTAKLYYEECVPEFNNWVKAIDAGMDRSGQMPPERGIESMECNAGFVASGDFVVGSSRFQEEIRKIYENWEGAKKGLNAPDVFEMEAYGALLTAESFNVPFGMIKGVSDLAGEDKSNTHRLCAISSASALLWSLITDRAFLGDIAGWGRPVTQDERGCPLSLDPAIRCVLAEEQISDDKSPTARSCNRLFDGVYTDWKSTFIKSKEVRSGRLFQEVNWTDYSKAIESIIAEPNSAVTFVFPYDLRDLIRFCLDKTVKRREANVIDLYRRDGTLPDSGEEGVLEAILNVGKDIRESFGHFKVCDDMCNRILHEHEGDIASLNIASRVSRLIRMPLAGDLSGEQQLLPVIYPAVLGLYTPAIEIINDGHYMSDMTFISRNSIERPDLEMALLHRPDVRMLVAIGRCTEAGITEPKIFELLQVKREKLDRLTQAEEELAQGRHFKRFQIMMITEPHKELILDALYQGGISDTAQAYFEHILSQESLRERDQ